MATVTKPIALDESLNTTEQTPRNVADVLAQELSAVATAIGGIAVPSADHVSYDNSVSGLSATDVQNALDEIVSDIPTVNDGTLTIQQNGETKGTFTANQSGNSIVNIETPTTDIQTAVDEFETYNGGLLSECKVALSPIQDLHGYDSPWVGGAGKNKWAFGDFTGGYSNVPFSLSAGTYTISKSDNNVASIRFMGGSMSIPVSFTSSATVTLTEATTSINYYSGDGTATNVMIESGSTATAFEPYSNICPISGHTQVKVGDDGKNLLEIPYTDSSKTVSGITYTVKDNGDIAISGTATASSYFTFNHARQLVGNGQYIFSKGTADNVIIGADRCRISDNAYINRYADNVSSPTTSEIMINIEDADSNYARFWINVKNGETVNTTIHPMLRLASDTDPTFVPYNSYQVTVNLGGTYYSGTLDVVSGVFIADMASVDLGTLTWTKDSSKTFYAFITDSLTGLQDMWCEVLDPYPENYRLNEYNNYPDNIIARNTTQKNVYVKCTTYEDGTASDFRTAMSGYKLVYELATPTPIQLSPTMVKALVGENHLSAPLEGQEITESKYKQMFTFDDVIAYIQSLS